MPVIKRDDVTSDAALARAEWLEAEATAWRARALAAEAEVERLLSAMGKLAEALREIAKLDAEDADPGFNPGPDYWAGVSTAAGIAEEALAEITAPADAR